MKTRLLRRASAGALALALIGIAPSYADNTVPDGDGTAPVAEGALSLGTVCTGSTASDDVLVAISRNGNYSTSNVFQNGSTVTVSVLSVSGAGLGASVNTPGTIGLPLTWATVGNNAMSDAVTSQVSLVAGATPRTLSGTVTYRASGIDAGGETLRRDGTLSVTATVANCNTAPSITVNDVTLEGNTLGGRTLSFTDIGTATDPEDPAPPAVSCSPALGSLLPLGANPVTCTATDSANATTSDSGVITVVDTVAPSLTNVPDTATVEAASASGATHSYASPTASDIVWGSVSATCAPASGSTFPLGATTVTCTATDGSGNTATAQFAVNVQDTTAPIIAAADVTVEGNTLGGADVAFSNPTATDAVDGATAVTCDRQSGEFFALGSTTVTCTSEDSAGNIGVAAFVVTVEDTTGPDITTSDVSVEGNTMGGANVNFPAPTASDIVDGPTSVICDFGSGDFFPLGSTTVTCSSSDSSGNSSEATFTVEVVDTTAPGIVGLPADITIEGDAAGGAYHAYTEPTAADVVDPAASVTCIPPPGFFALGSTTVTCTATDASGNSSSDSFDVTVEDTTPPSIQFKSRTPAANGNGWNNSDVTVSWDCSDLVSGVVKDVVSETVTTEGQNQSATGTCVDNSGNTADETVGGISIDKTAPTLGISGATSGAYTACAIPTRPSFAPADGLSGIAPTPSETWTTPNTASGVGTYTYLASATDYAGNSSTETRTYSVTYGSGFTGFLQPINNDGTSRFKLGSTVPVKFQLSCGGAPVTTAIVKLFVKRDDGIANPGIDEAISTAAATTGNLFRYSDGQYIFNLSTKAGYTNPNTATTVAFAQGTWTISALLDDGTYRSVNIQLVK